MALRRRIPSPEGRKTVPDTVFFPSVVACMPLSTQGCLCVLDNQDSCFSFSLQLFERGSCLKEGEHVLIFFSGHIGKGQRSAVWVKAIK
jgi:hypothetical protein